jgi:DNA-binding NarL/FixJ family response regulator
MISLPLLKVVSRTATPVNPRTAIPANPPKIRIYIVDDHPLIRKALAALFTAEGDMVVCGEAGSAEAAFNEIAALQPDIVIVDLTLRGNSGLELIKTIRGLRAEIGVIVVSIHDENVYGLRSLRAGAGGYVMKGDAPEKIVTAVRAIRSGRVFASTQLADQVIGRVRGGEDLGASPVSGLTDRELEIAELIGRGDTTAEIASRLHVSVKTVETHRKHIKDKLHLENGTQLIHFCARWIQEKDTCGAAAAAG